MEISFKQTLFSIDPKNKRCNDCGEKHISYVSVNNGITICNLCAQIHRQLGTKLSELKKIDEEFDDYTMNFFIYGGNKKFRRALRHMGVNLDVKKGTLYRTYGADFYRRNLKSIVKGNSQLEKDFKDPNEVMPNDSNSFSEFENYIINNYKNNDGNLNIFNNLVINLDSNANFGEMINNPVNTSDNNNSDLNNNNNNIQISRENKIVGIKSEPEKDENKDKTDDENINMKKVLDFSIENAKKFGIFMKKEGIKGYGLMKKYSGVIAEKSKPTISKVTKYVKEHVPNFNKNKNNEEENNQENQKEDEKNE